LYKAKFGWKTEIVQSLAANPDYACCLAFLDQPEVLAILKNIPQLKLYKALEAHHSKLLLLHRYLHNLAANLSLKL